MALNGSTLNGVTLNGAARNSAPADPEYIVRGVGYRWRLRLLVGGLDLTAQLTGIVDADREEGAAGVAGFALHIAPGTPVVPTDWIGKTVSLDYISTTAGVTTEGRRYTGQIASPVWNPVTRLLSCECSDQLQQRVEAMSIAAIDSLVGGYWSADLFEPVEGRSHWDYALERLSTRPVSLDASPSGELRVTGWYAAAPHFVFGPGTTLYQSLRLDLAPLSSITNRVEIEFSYRYNRLWQRNQAYSWTHPQTGGNTGLGGFCNWQHSGGSETPDIEMVKGAAADKGQTVINADYYLVPLTTVGGQNAGQVCDPQFAWINVFDTLLLGATWTGARRWVQTVTETYSLVLATAAGEVEQTRVVQRAGYAFEIEDSSAEAWESDPITGGTGGATDLDDESRRATAINLALQIGKTEIIAAHRETLVSWDAPTGMALGVDLIHTLELNAEGVRAVGKCRRIVDRFDLASGSAITTLTLAVMRGGGVSDPLTLPARLGVGVVATPDSGTGLGLPTQLGYPGGPAYDDALNGFAGNLPGDSADPYPRRLTVPADEIPASERDENLLTVERLYRVGIPDDALEM